ncbi:hypothetical protein ACJJH9_14890 [Microbulbifer sp. DLAB2-AF]|uniref:hypothetical protein n=1 Tax=Microbulbifer sp. DLAB2-AF TaxID=3243395 RepID=UPI0040396D52
MSNRVKMSKPSSRPKIHKEGVSEKLIGRFDKDLLGFSRHHIVDIQGMGEFFDIGRMIIKNPAFDGSKVDSLQRSVASGGPLSNAARSAPIGLSTQQSLRDCFMWSPINLFSGPSAKFRSDDPESGYEQVRPLSMSKVRWEVLTDIQAFLDLFPRRQGRIDGDILNSQLVIQYMELLDKLVGLTKTGEGRIHIFNYSDWKLTGTRRENSFGYRLKKSLY